MSLKRMIGYLCTRGPGPAQLQGRVSMHSYKRVKGRSHTVEKRKAIHPGTRVHAYVGWDIRT